MSADAPRALSPADHAWVLALNAAHEAETGALSADALDRLARTALAAAAIGQEAFVIALDQTADYASPNFLWFRQRFAAFAYVDRVIVAAAARGRGHARALYAHVFAAARAAGFARVCCEVNYDPPNPASEAFHAALGFAEIGRARLANGKGVIYLEARL